MRYYLAYLSYNTALRNNLEKDLFEHLKQENRKLIPERVFKNKYKEQLINQIDELNKKHSRCKPLTVYFHNHNYDQYISLHTGTGIVFQFLLTQELS
jgi:hypothetical protein